MNITDNLRNTAKKCSIISYQQTDPSILNSFYIYDSNEKFSFLLQIST
jgi:hypothetical protein